MVDCKAEVWFVEEGFVGIGIAPPLSVLSSIQTHMESMAESGRRYLRAIAYTSSPSPSGVRGGRQTNNRVHTDWAIIHSESECVNCDATV